MARGRPVSPTAGDAAAEVSLDASTSAGRDSNANANAQATSVPKPSGEGASAACARALRWLSQREHSRKALRERLLRPRGGPRAAEAPALDEAAVDRVLDWLHAQGYLSDQRFIVSRLHQRSAAWGERRIAQELKQHGLALPAQDQTRLRDTELARAQALFQRRFGRADGLTGQDQPCPADTGAAPPTDDAIADRDDRNGGDDRDSHMAGRCADDLADATESTDSRRTSWRARQREARRQANFLLSRGFSAEVVRRVVSGLPDDDAS